MGCETVPRIPLWEAIYAHHRPQAPHCHFPPRKASSCHDRCETPAICIVLDWFRSQDRVVVVDAHSKWPEVISVSSTTSSSTIEVLRDLFARFGIHEQIISDNGAQFVSEEFQAFVRSNGIRHITSVPYHPATNGLAERAVQTFKQALRPMYQNSKPVKEKLAKFFIAHRNTPYSTTSVSPAQLLLGRL